MTRLRRMLAGVTIAAAAAGAFTVLSGRGHAGPEKIAFPASFTSGVLYTMADRHDIRPYRELYATPGAVEAAKAGQPPPPGTVPTLLQYKAQVDAQGNPLKDADGRSVGGDPTIKPPPVVDAISVLDPTGAGLEIVLDSSVVAVVVHNGSNRPKDSPFHNDAGKLVIVRVTGKTPTRVTEGPAGIRTAET